MLTSSTNETGVSSGSRAGDYSFEDWLRGYVRDIDVDVRQEHRPQQTGKRYSSSIVYHKKLALEILDPRPHDLILDLGCATGAMTVYCSMQGARCVGIDLSMKALRTGAAYLDKHALPGTVLASDAGNLPFRSDLFDKIISCDLYEHLDRDTKRRVFAEARRVLKPGGTFVLKTPNLWYLKLGLLYKRARALLQFKNPFHVVIPHTPAADGAAAEHIGLASSFQIEKELLSAGFFDYRFHYGLATKFLTNRRTLNRLLVRELPVVRDVLVEEVLVTAEKSRMSSLLPD